VILICIDRGVFMNTCAHVDLWCCLGR